MKILYVITQGEQGGAQRYVKTLAVESLAVKHQVFVAIGESTDSFLQRELTAKGLETFALAKLKRNISPINDLLAIFELAKLLRTVQPDIIHLNSTKAGIVGTLASVIYDFKKHKHRLIYTAHGWVFNEDMNLVKKWLYKLLEKITAGRKDKIICVSDYDRWTALGEKIAPADKLVAIHNGIKAEEINFLTKDEARKKLFPKTSPKATEIIIGAIANFYPTKGLAYLIQAVKILVYDYKLPIKAVIIGDGNLRPQLEELIKQSQLENQLILAGQIKNASAYLKACDIAVMSSVKEGLPYFLLEAMTASLPCVATKAGGMPEVIKDNETGLLAETKNPSDLADKIRLLAEDIDLRIRFGQAGLARAKKEFSQEAMIKSTLALYEK